VHYLELIIEHVVRGLGQEEETEPVFASRGSRHVPESSKGKQFDLSASFWVIGKNLHMILGTPIPPHPTLLLLLSLSLSLSTSDSCNSNHEVVTWLLPCQSQGYVTTSFYRLVTTILYPCNKVIIVIWVTTSYQCEVQPRSYYKWGWDGHLGQSCLRGLPGIVLWRPMHPQDLGKAGTELCPGDLG
jgi:hypothetical protein